MRMKKFVILLLAVGIVQGVYRHKSDLNIWADSETWMIKGFQCRQSSSKSLDDSQIKVMSFRGSRLRQGDKVPKNKH